MADPSGSSANDNQHCVDCGAAAPNPEEGSTLRSTYGWRLMPEMLPNGRMAARWHCPSCWQRKKQQAKPR